MNSSFKRNLIIGFGISLLLLLLSAIASYISIQSLLHSAERVNHSDEVIKNLDGIVLSIKEGEAGQRGYLLSDDDRFLNSYTGARDAAMRYAGQLQRLTVDNAEQQKDMPALKQLIEDRFMILESLITKKKVMGLLSRTDFDSGFNYTRRLTALTEVMKQREIALLATRTERMNRFAAATPLLIIVAALIAIAVTIVSYLRVNADFKKRVQLQEELEQKDREITQRLNLIQGLANKVSSGDYKIKIDDEGKDLLGSLAASLNVMAQSLDRSFQSLSEKEWMQSGIAQLNDKMLGQKSPEILSDNIIQFF